MLAVESSRYINKKYLDVLSECKIHISYVAYASHPPTEVNRAFDQVHRAFNLKTRPVLPLLLLFVPYPDYSSRPSRSRTPTPNTTHPVLPCSSS